MGRPRVIDAVIRAEVERLLHEGASNAAISVKTGCTASYISAIRCRVLRLPPATKYAGFDWTDAATAKLKALWADGVSASAIGRQIGVTKSAVTGKAHRIGLPQRETPITGSPITSESDREERRRASRRRQKRRAAERAAQRRREAKLAAPKVQVFVIPTPKPKPVSVNGTIEDAITAFIRVNGVTRCPIAALNPTTATIPPEAKAAIRAHEDAMQYAWLQTHQIRAARGSKRSAELRGGGSIHASGR